MDASNCARLSSSPSRRKEDTTENKTEIVEAPSSKLPVAEDTTREEELAALYLHASKLHQYPPSLGHHFCNALVHSWRTLGYAPWLALALKKYPRQLLLALLSYYSLRFKAKWWNDEVHRFLRYAASLRPRLIQANSKRYDKNKQYLICIHPHGILACGLFNLMSRYMYDEKRGSHFPQGCSLLDDVEIYLCFAPIVQYLPFHGELYQEKGTGATAGRIRQILTKTKASPALVPGGFSELVYTNYREGQEVAFLQGRYGFVKIAIEQGVDIIPLYTFGLNQMYRLMDWQRHRRAVLSQKWNLPFLMFWGKAGTAVPFTEDVVTVTFDPFPTSKYRMDQFREAHHDYCVYLQKCFDEYKHVTEGTKNAELVFAGRDQLPAKL